MKLPNLPEKCGVYIFRDSKGQPLYVGKAVNLKSRVKSYFQKDLGLGPKTKVMVSKATKIEYIETESELEALLLEADLIKRLKPRYNIRWKDDKNYKYIKISNSQFLISNLKKTAWDERCFPRVATARTKKDDGGEYFGPYPEGNVREVLQTLRRIFPFRDCAKTKFLRYQRLFRPCLYRDINLCPAPCVRGVTPLHYSRVIESIKLYLFGKRGEVETKLRKEMEKASRGQNFEEAAKLRDQLKHLEFVGQVSYHPKDYLDHPNLLEDKRREELATLARQLSVTGYQLPALKRIEAYDVSNIRGKLAVGSMVVFTRGEADKNQYRKFKIKFKETPDDAAMLSEILKRRFKRMTERIKADNSSSKSPNLILIDGGKSQVKAAIEVLKQYKLKIPVLGLAKREEKVVSYQLEVVSLPQDSPALNLLKRIRDEAHRFALIYHRKLRSKF